MHDTTTSYHYIDIECNDAITVKILGEPNKERMKWRK